MSRLKVKFMDWGRIGFQEAWEKQTELHNRIKDIKISNRRNGTSIPQEHYLIFCEHEPVYTLGKSGSMDNLLINEIQLEEDGIDFHKINRGGDITFHGPGQIVAYPIFDLDEMFTDVHKYVRYLEETILRVLKSFGISAIRMKDFTGVWLPESNDKKARKICAIGVHLSRWVTMHGLAFNVNTDLKYFRNIIPCGIDDEDKVVCSLASELNKTIDYEAVKELLKKEFENVYDIELVA